jgi:hypothetical protein
MAALPHGPGQVREARNEPTEPDLPTASWPWFGRGGSNAPVFDAVEAGALEGRVLKDPPASEAS